MWEQEGYERGSWHQFPPSLKLFGSTSQVVCALSLPKPGALITANANAVLQPLGEKRRQAVEGVDFLRNPGPALVIKSHPE